LTPLVRWIDVYHVRLTRVTVYTYEWSNHYIADVSVIGTDPDWYAGASPVQAITTESPLGDGSTLVRSELFLALAWNRVGPGHETTHALMALLSLSAMGDVYPVGSGGFPDPTTRAEAQITAAGRPVLFDVWDGANYCGHGTLGTDGFVTSQGIRGPAKYGGGTPELRVGLKVGNAGATNLIFQEYACSWTYHLRALWRV
jgi:hypothetical protein